MIESECNPNGYIQLINYYKATLKAFYPHFRWEEMNTSSVCFPSKFTTPTSLLGTIFSLLMQQESFCAFKGSVFLCASQFTIDPYFCASLSSIQILLTTQLMPFIETVSHLSPHCGWVFIGHTKSCLLLGRKPSKQFARQVP